MLIHNIVKLKGEGGLNISLLRLKDHLIFVWKNICICIYIYVFYKNNVVYYWNNNTFYSFK